MTTTKTKPTFLTCRGGYIIGNAKKLLKNDEAENSAASGAGEPLYPGTVKDVDVDFEKLRNDIEAAGGMIPDSQLNGFSFKRKFADDGENGAEEILLPTGLNFKK